MKSKKSAMLWTSTFFYVMIIYFAIKIEESQIISYIFKYPFNMTNFLTFLFPYSIMSVILVIGIYIIVKKHPLTQNSVNKIASAIFSLLLLIGHCYSTIGAFFIVFRYLLTAILGICYWGGFYLIFRHIFSLIETNISRISPYFSKKDKLRLFNKHTFLFSWLCIFICWLPYIIIRYPAGFEWDAYHQIQQFLGIETLTAHWPVGSTVLMGLWIKAGTSIFHSYEIGALLFVLFQSLVAITILAYSLVFIKEAGVPSLWGVMILANYSLIPIYPAFFTSIVKDSLFSIIVLLDIILVAKKLLLKKKGGFLGITLTSVAMCLLRNNGIHIVLFWLAITAIYFIIRKDQIIIPLMASFAVTFIIFVLYSNVLLLNLGIQKGGMQESLSIPFQQTARYLKLHPDDISEAEKETIGKVLNVDNIADLYNPLLSDPVKSTFHGSKSDLLEYFKVWFQLFFRHPITYADAALHTCYGFFYPNAREDRNQIVGLYIGTISDGEIIFYQPASLRGWLIALAEFTYFLERCPITFPFYNVPLHMWAAIWLIIYWLKKRSMTNIILLMPSIVGILVCIASPTWWNNGFRYALPIVCANPFLLALTKRNG